MPILPETPEQTRLYRQPLGREPAPPEAGPGTLGVLGAAFRLNNPATSVYEYLQRRAGLADDPEFRIEQLRDEIAGSRYEAEYLDRFAGVGSMAEAHSIMRQIDQEEADRRIMSGAGVGGIVASVAAGMADPTIFIPGTVFLKGGRAGLAAIRTGISTAAAGAAAAALQETALGATQQTRTLDEAAVNIGAATILSGILGAGAGALLSRAERSAAVAKLQADREAWARDLGQTGAGQPQAVGAAATDTRDLTLQSFGLDRIPAVQRLVTRISPTLRTFSGPFVTARRILADLAETPLRFTGNRRGVPTTQGPALDRVAKLAERQTRVAVSEELDRLFAQYRTGRADTGFAASQVLKLRASAARLASGDARMTNLEFREAVGRAMREGDTSTIPEVTQAAQFVRQKVFEPWKERAIAAGLLPEDVSTETATSYFTRVYNQQRIIAQRPQFTERITGWLESEQAVKRQTQERLTAMVDELDDRLAKLESGKLDEAALIENQRRADMLRHQVEQEIVAWRGKSTADAMSAIRAREKKAAGRDPNAPQLESADRDVLNAARKIIRSERDLSRQELQGRAGEIVDRILGSPDGRLPYDAPSGGPRIGGSGEARPRGPLAAREFMIPDKLIEDFLESDVEQVMQTYLRTMIPDVLLTERFGDVDMTMAFKALREERERLAAAAPDEKARNRIEKDYTTAVRDLAAIRDRIRNVYGFNPDLRNLARVTMAAKVWNYVSDLGGVALTSISDIAGPIFVHGFTGVFKGGWAPFARSVKRFAGEASGSVEAKRQLRAMGIVVETRLAARTNDVYELVDAYRPQSRFERILHATAEKSSLVNLIAPWTDLGKTMAGGAAFNEILRATADAAAGKLKPRDLERLAASGIDEAMAVRIWRQFEATGETLDGIHLPNTADWTDRAARDAFEGAVARDADIAIISPGQEKPLWLSRPIGGLLGQFKTFGAAATERYLIAGLQRHDAAALSGLMAGVTAGMFSYFAYMLATGKDISSNPADWVREGVGRSGALGWLEEGNTFISKVSRGTIDIYRLIGSDRPGSRYSSRSAFSQLLGPTAGKLENMIGAAGSLATGDWTATDTHNLRRVLFFQNVFYLRQLLDQVEKKANAALGVPERPQ